MPANFKAKVNCLLLKQILQTRMYSFLNQLEISAYKKHSNSMLNNSLTPRVNTVASIVSH